MLTHHFFVFNIRRHIDHETQTVGRPCDPQAVQGRGKDEERPDPGSVRAGEAHINAFDPALCNAAILDMGCYPIHALISMFGEPAHVSAEAYHLESGFEAGGIALLRYPGFVCEAIWSKVCRQASPTTFMGEDGSILLDDINHIRRIWLVRRSGETVELPYREKLPNNMMYELREFAGYIASGTQPEKRNRDSVITASVIEQARRQTGTLFDGE